MSKVNLKTVMVVLLALTALGSVEAFAANGGLQKAQTATDEIKTMIYAIVGSASGLYLLYIGIMAKMGKQSWSDFFMGMFQVAIVGASLVLGTYFWGLFA